MTITLRNTKGSALTHAELDANFSSLTASDGSSLVGFLQSGSGAVARTVQAKLRDVVSVKDFAATGDGVTDDRAAFQAAVDAINTAGGGMVFIPRGVYKINSTINLKQRVILQGEGINNDQELGTVIVGAAGIDIFSFPSSGSHSEFVFRDFQVSGGANQFVVPSTVASVTYVKAISLLCSGPSGACWKAGSQIEEWYFDQVLLSGGQYGFKKENTGANPLLDKSTFKDVRTTGQTINGWRIEGSGSHGTNTWINPIFNNITQHAFFADCGAFSWIFINANTEGTGQGSKNNRTTGSITAATNALTIASATGYANGDPVVVQGAGANGIDLFTTVSSGGGTVNLVLAANASTTVTNAQVTNANYDDFHFENSIATSQDIVFIGGAIAAEGSGGKLRYAIDARGISGCSLFGVRGAGNIPVYDPNQTTSIIGGTIDFRQPDNVLTENFRRTAFPSTTREFSKTIVPSPPGRALVLGLRDSLDNGTGTYGNLEARRQDSNRRRFFYVNTTTGQLFTDGGLTPGSFGSGTGASLDSDHGKQIVYGEAAPTAGTWKLGDVVINSAPSVGQPKGWRCTVAGTPGTWVSEGNL